MLHYKGLKYDSIPNYSCSVLTLLTLFVGFDRDCGDVLGSITGANRGVILVYLPFLIIAFGLIGNALNIIVYSHKGLKKSPVNAIFKAQAICDFFLLLNHLYLRSWMFLPSSVGRNTILTVILLSVLLYIRELRLSASWLHIVLAHRRYLAIVNPLQSRVRLDMQSTRRSIILIIVGCLVESFVLTVLFFLCTFIISNRLSVIILPIYYQLPFAVTFVVLSIMSIRFIVAVIKLRNERNCTDIPMSQTSQPVNRIGSMPVNRMVLVLLGVFFMTEIPPIISLFLNLKRHEKTHIDSGCVSTLLFFNVFLYVAPSMNTLCYLIMSTQYRRALKSVCSFRNNSRSTPEPGGTDSGS